MKKEEEEMKVDYKELEKQRREKILKSDNYARYEIIIPEETDETPYGTIELHNVNKQSLVKLMLSIEDSLEKMKKEYSELYILGKIMYGIETTSIDYNDIENEEDKK